MRQWWRRSLSTRISSRPDIHSPTALYLTRIAELKAGLSCDSTENEIDMKNSVQWIVENELHPNMAGDQATLLVIVGSHLRDYPLVLDTFHQLEQHQVPHSPITLELTAKAAKECRDVPAALNVAKEMYNSELITPSIEIYQNCAQACLEKGEWMNAITLLEQAVRFDLVPSNAIVQHTAQVCVDCEEWTALDNVFQLFVQPFFTRQEKIELKLELLQQMTRCNHVQPATDYYTELRQDGITIPEYVYHDLIHMYVRLMLWNHSLNVLAHMAGQEDVVTQDDSKIRGFETIEMMEKMKVPLTYDAFQASLLASGRTGQFEQVQAIRELMIRHGQTPDFVYYIAFLNSCRGDQLQATDGIFQEYTAERDVSQWHLSVVQAFLNNCMKKREWKSVIDVCTQLLEHKVAFDKRFSSLFVVALVRDRQHDEALSYFRQMKTAGVHLSVEAHSSIMHVYRNQGDWEGSLRLFEFMQRQEMNLNSSSFAIAMKAYRDGGMEGKILDLYFKMLEEEVFITVEAWLVLLETHPDRWREAWHSIRSHPQWSQKLFRKIVYAGSSNSNMQYSEFEELIDQANANGMKWDASSYSTIIRRFALFNHSEKAIAYLDQMLALGLEPVEQTFNSCLNALLYDDRLSSVNRAAKVIQITSDMNPELLQGRILLTLCNLCQKLQDPELKRFYYNIFLRIDPEAIPEQLIELTKVESFDSFETHLTEVSSHGPKIGHSKQHSKSKHRTATEVN